MGDFRMPSLGADMDAGTVSTWMVKPGDEVHRGDIVAVVETEKSTIEVEIFESGVIEEILVPEGEQVPVGTVLARVVSAPAGAPEAAAPPAATPKAAAPDTKPDTTKARTPPEAGDGAARAAPKSATPEPKRVEPEPKTGDGTRAAASAHAPRRGTGPALVTSPVVRHLADVRGVDLARVPGSGPGGSVVRADVERAGAADTARAADTAGAASVPAGTPGGTGAAGAAVAPAGAPPGTRVRSSPLARRLAADLGVDMAAVTGTGPGGAVVEPDVRRAAEARSRPASAAGAVTEPAPVAPPAVTADALREPALGTGDRRLMMRRAIGALMARSKREIPHYYLGTTVDMSRSSAWLAESNLTRPVAGRLVIPVLMLKATALAVAEVPEMNGFMRGEEFEPSAAVHVGVAISLRSGGVIAPAIHDAETLSLDELMAALRDLVTRARQGVLRSSEMSDPTITVSNLGDLGVDEVYGVIYPPQVALVGFGRVIERPWASEGMIGVRPSVKVTLSADHRVSDGHRGGVFLAAIDRLLQEPEAL